MKILMIGMILMGSLAVQSGMANDLSGQQQKKSKKHATNKPKERPAPPDIIQIARRKHPPLHNHN